MRFCSLNLVFFAFDSVEYIKKVDNIVSVLQKLAVGKKKKKIKNEYSFISTDEVHTLF